MSAPPAGRTPGDWLPLSFDDPFCRHVGPLLMLMTGDDQEPVRFGMEVTDRHCNRLGFCHGGMLATFMDLALGYCAATAAGHTWGGPTVDLKIDFLRAAERGEWIESRVTTEHHSRSLMFVRGSILAGSGIVAVGTAIFKQPRVRGG